ncbi:fumarylacetoacetate hydrolase family protein [Pseudomonas prosekii]|uniref:fumarylacetoacetate hydrolase family protein n=1 Tax=Pseudomonas prosekii TaxID=1148509 RepID=UPI0011EB34D0|nr:fumarylacetoacetate hydrolase family protein [Pseudomonas prosekii]
MKLVTIDDVKGGSAGAQLTSGEILHLGRAAHTQGLESWLPPSVRSILAAGSVGLDVVRGIISRVSNASPQQLDTLRRNGTLTGRETRLLAPVPDPRLIVAAGLAYRSHLEEMSGTPSPPHPTGFMKSPHSVTGPDRAVTLPRDANAHVDYEGELAVVFGRPCHDVSADEAMGYIAGYCVANDLSARDWVRDVWNAQAPWEARRTWEVNIMGKQFNGFTPLGPVLVTADEIPVLGDLRIVTRINGDVLQDAPVSDLIFDLAETIAWFSRWYHFEPGDVLLTGTPAGVGVGRQPQKFMADGDVVEVEIDGIGRLRNYITRGDH